MLSIKFKIYILHFLICFFINLYDFCFYLFTMKIFKNILHVSIYIFLIVLVCAFLNYKIGKIIEGKNLYKIIMIFSILIKFSSIIFILVLNILLNKEFNYFLLNVFYIILIFLSCIIKICSNINKILIEKYLPLIIFNEKQNIDKFSKFIMFNNIFYKIITFLLLLFLKYHNWRNYLEIKPFIIILFVVILLIFEYILIYNIHKIIEIKLIFINLCNNSINENTQLLKKDNIFYNYKKFISCFIFFLIFIFFILFFDVNSFIWILLSISIISNFIILFLNCLIFKKKAIPLIVTNIIIISFIIFPNIISSNDAFILLFGSIIFNNIYSLNFNILDKLNLNINYNKERINYINYLEYILYIFYSFNNYVLIIMVSDSETINIPFIISLVFYFNIFK